MKNYRWGIAPNCPAVIPQLKENEKKTVTENYTKKKCFAFKKLNKKIKLK